MEKKWVAGKKFWVECGKEKYPVIFQICSSEDASLRIRYARLEFFEMYYSFKKL